MKAGEKLSATAKPFIVIENAFGRFDVVREADGKVSASYRSKQRAQESVNRLNQILGGIRYEPHQTKFSDNHS